MDSSDYVVNPTLPKKTQKSAQPYRLSDDVYTFRARYGLIVGDTVLESARTRYHRSQEATIFVTDGHGRRAATYTFTAKPSHDNVLSRRGFFLRVAHDLQARLPKAIRCDGDDAPELPAQQNDQLRLFVAFKVLIETANIVDETSTTLPEVQNEQHRALHMILDLYPTAAIIHGRIRWNDPATLSKFGIITAKRRLD